MKTPAERFDGIIQRAKEREPDAFSRKVLPMVRCGNCYWFEPTGKVYEGKFGYIEGICKNQVNHNDPTDLSYVGDCERCDCFVVEADAWWETPEGKRYLEREIKKPNS